MLEKEAIVTEVTMGRLITNTLLTIFVPTILLLEISFTARAFAEDYMNMVIQVNLTILLHTLRPLGVLFTVACPSLYGEFFNSVGGAVFALDEVLIGLRVIEAFDS